MVAIAERVTTPVITHTQEKRAALTPLTKRAPYGGTGVEVSRLCWGTGLMATLKHNLSHEDAARILVRKVVLKRRHQSRPPTQDARPPPPSHHTAPAWSAESAPHASPAYA